VNRVPVVATVGACYRRRVRILGLLLFALASAGTVYSTWAMYNRKRPADVVFALVAPLAALIALAGLLLAFVPDFFG